MTEEQRAFYRDNGYLAVPRVFGGDECARMRDEIDAIVAGLEHVRDLDATWSGAWREHAGLRAGERVLSVHGLLSGRASSIHLPVHIVVEDADLEGVIITAYVPDTSRWRPGWKRKKPRGTGD